MLRASAKVNWVTSKVRNFAIIYLVSPGFIRRARNEKCMDYFIRIRALRSFKIVQMYAPIVVHFDSKVTPVFDEKRSLLFQRLFKNTLYNGNTPFLGTVLHREGICGILAEVTDCKTRETGTTGRVPALRFKDILFAWFAASSM